MRVKLDPRRLSLSQRPARDGLVNMIGFRLLLDHLVNRGREPRHLLDRNHVKLGLLLLRQLDRRRKRPRGTFRTVIGYQKIFLNMRRLLDLIPPGASIGFKVGMNHRCAISVGTTALPITAVTRIVYSR